MRVPPHETLGWTRRCCCSPTGGSRPAGTPTRRGSRRRSRSATSRDEATLDALPARPAGDDRASPTPRSPPPPRSAGDRDGARRRADGADPVAAAARGRRADGPPAAAGRPPGVARRRARRRSTGASSRSCSARSSPSPAARPTTRRRSRMHHLVGGGDVAPACACSASTRSPSPRSRPPRAPLIDDLVAPADDWAAAAPRRPARARRRPDRHPRRGPRALDGPALRRLTTQRSTHGPRPPRRPRAPAPAGRRRAAATARCASASAARSAAARRRSSARCACCCATSSRSPSSPTTSSRPRTPRRCAGPAVLPTERIVAVETGCCPHTAIRDDIAANLDAAESLEAALGDVDVTLIESGGDNLTAIFSRGLVDAQIFVLDTAGGDDVPRKGGPGVAIGRPARDQQGRPRAARRRRRRPHARRRRRRRRSGPVLPTSLRDAGRRGRASPTGCARSSPAWKVPAHDVRAVGARSRSPGATAATCSSTCARSRRWPSAAPATACCSSAARRRRSAATSWRSTSSSAPAPACRSAPSPRRWRGRARAATPSSQTRARRRRRAAATCAGCPSRSSLVAGCRHRTTTTGRPRRRRHRRGSSRRSSLGRTGEPSGDARRCRGASSATGASLVHHAERLGPDVPGWGSAVTTGRPPPPAGGGRRRPARARRARRSSPPTRRSPCSPSPPTPGSLLATGVAAPRCPARCAGLRARLSDGSGER